METGNEIDLFAGDERNTTAQTAWACVVFAMVPYLGMIFVPFALGFAVWALIRSYSEPNIGGARLSGISAILSIGIFMIQLLLWWLLYVIPELGLGPYQ